MGYLFTNWKTSAAGLGALLVSAGTIINSLSSGGGITATEITGLMAAFGLFAAKDANVSGGTVKQAIAALALLVISSSVMAADLSRPQPQLVKAPIIVSAPNWTGIYLGAYGSYAGNLTNMVTSVGNGVATIDLGGVPHGPGFGGMVEALYQAQSSPWVIGLDAEISVLNLQQGGALSTPPAQLLSVSNDTNYLGAFNVEVGYAYEKARFYGFGGLAFGGAKPNLQAAGICVTTPLQSCQQAINDTSVGWDAGAGVDYSLSPVVSLFARGSWTELGDKSLTIPAAGGGVIATSNAQFHILKQDAGLKFKIGGPN